MSLLDALLLDPYRINVWIAYRTDGVKGTGTQNDPYDGSTRFAVAVTISTLANTLQEATATTSVAHGYSDYDVVTVDTGSAGTPWNGTFIIYGVGGAGSTTFKYLMNSIKPELTAAKTRRLNLDIGRPHQGRTISSGP